jgi:hypothetical protein
MMRPWWCGELPSLMHACVWDLHREHTGGTCSAAKHGLSMPIMHVCVLKHGEPPADGGHPGGRADTPVADRRALCYGWARTLALWGKGGCGGSPNVEAGKMYQQGEGNDGGGGAWQLGNVKFQVRWCVCVVVCGVCCTPRARVKLKKSQGRR